MSTEPITGVELEEYFVDKDTGAPLAGGFVQFWKDADRVVAKLVYEKVATGALDGAGNPVYQFVPLPDPVVLSAVGTPQNAGGDNVAIYYWPYQGTPEASDGTVELYYVAVFNSLGVEEFTREGWPGSGVSGSAAGDGAGGENMLSNSQFVEVNFNTTLGWSYTSVGAESISVEIAPKWTLNATFTGVGTITVNRVAIAGNANVVTNPPFTLSVVGGVNVSALELVQRLSHNPGIWTASDAGINGFVSSYMILGPASSATIRYEPSVGAPVELLTGTNVGAEYTPYSATIQLDPSANTDTGTAGFVDITLILPPAGTTLISSLQILALETNVTGLPYIQEPVNRQEDHLFNFYNPLLQYKPIPSYLIGWDFKLNPFQIAGSTVAASAIGANKSKYVWDQTIIFQSVDSSLGITRSASGMMRVTAAATTKGAIIQYLNQRELQNILSYRFAISVSAKTNQVAGVPTTVSVYATTDASLPDITTGTNNSIVATINAAGKPLTFNGTWTEVGRSKLGDARFTIETSTTQNSNDYGFFGWDSQGSVLINNATFFAVVVGFGELTSGNYIDFDAVGLCNGDIPTTPAPMTFQDTQRSLQYYYEQSYLIDTLPGTITASGAKMALMKAVSTITYLSTFELEYQRTKRVTPINTFYSPVTGAAGQVSIVMRENGIAVTCVSANPLDVPIGNWSSAGMASVYRNVYVAQATSGAALTRSVGSNNGDDAYINYHYTSDARLGVL